MADGRSYTEAAALAGRRAGDTVAKWVARFNREGLGALAPGHAGGPPPKYGEAERRRILCANAARIYGFDLDKLDPIAAECGPLVSDIDAGLDRVPDGARSMAFYKTVVSNV